MIIVIGTISYWYLILSRKIVFVFIQVEIADFDLIFRTSPSFAKFRAILSCYFIFIYRLIFDILMHCLSINRFVILFFNLHFNYRVLVIVWIKIHNTIFATSFFALILSVEINRGMTCMIHSLEKGVSLTSTPCCHRQWQLWTFEIGNVLQINKVVFNLPYFFSRIVLIWGLLHCFFGENFNMEEVLKLWGRYYFQLIAWNLIVINEVFYCDTGISLISDKLIKISVKIAGCFEASLNSLYKTLLWYFFCNLTFSTSV